MRSPAVLARIVAWCSRLSLRQRAGGGDRLPHLLSHPARSWAQRRGLRVGVLGCVLSAGVLGIGLSCVATDPEYCETRATCPYADTPIGPMQMLCHPTRHVCLITGPDLCVKDDECRLELSHCDLQTNACTACHVGDPSDTSCARFPDTPLCGTASDGAPRCLACRSNMDCQGDAPICENQKCRKCSEHSDCEGELRCDDNNLCTDSLVCIGEGEVSPDRAGRCAQNGSITHTNARVVYVNTLDPVCTPLPRDALLSPYGEVPATPQCKLEHALALAKTLNRRYIRVLGSNVLPPPAIGDGGAYSFIGAPRKGTTELAHVISRGGAFVLNGTGSLTLDQLDVTEMTPASVISCSGNTTGAVPRLTVRRSTVRGNARINEVTSADAAIAITSCNTVLDGNTVGVSTLTDTTSLVGAHGQGIYIADTRRDTSYLIQNNLIAGNMGAALDLQGAGKVTRLVARFNTIVGNGRKTPNSSGAILCAINAEGQQISHSILWNNSRSASERSQLANSGFCSLKDLVVGVEEGLPNQPAFAYVAPGLDENFRPITRSACVDQVTPENGETLPATDLFGTLRPQGIRWDIGAVERKP